MFNADDAVFIVSNRGFRYGDGFFETVRISNGNINLEDLHRKRIDRTISLLGYAAPATPLKDIFEQARELSLHNKCSENGRVRISFFNGNGTVFDDNAPLQFVIEAGKIATSISALNETGLTTGLCKKIKKSCDVYSNVKSANYLFSRVAIEFAKENNWDEALIINQNNNICESTIANIFWIKDGEIFTPPLSEGCVQGVMRDYLIPKISAREMICTPVELSDADEVFLSNATSGFRWVKNFMGKQYSNVITRELYNKWIVPLWP